MIRLTDRCWLCTFCGTVVENTVEREPTMITHVSLSKPRARHFYVDRDLVHTCTIDRDGVGETPSP